MDAQPEPLAIISSIEEWWGEQLSSSLIDRIAAAPFEHLEEFHDREVEIQGLYQPGHLPPLSPGDLRPVWGEALEPAGINYRTAAKMLLYVDSVVEDSHRLEPFNVVGMEDARSDHEYVRQHIRRDLEWLLGNKPLIEDGSILFTAKYRGVSHFGMWESIAGARPQRSSEAWQMSGNVLAAMEGTATPIAQSRGHEAGYRELLGGHAIGDGRLSELTTLARLPLPSFGDATLKSIVTLRASADEFAEWRQHLRAALGAVAELPESDSAATAAAAIVRDELSHSTHALTRAVKKSPALSAMRSAGSGLGITALGAAGSMGAASLLDPSDPNLMVGALVGAVPGAAETIRSAGRAYVEASHARQTGKAVWSILGSFERDIKLD